MLDAGENAGELRVGERCLIHTHFGGENNFKRSHTSRFTYTFLSVRERIGQS